MNSQNKSWLEFLPYVIVAALAIFANLFWLAFPPVIKFLACWLGLVVLILVAYWRLRPRSKVDEPLKESHGEKFQRLIGLYHTIPNSILQRPENKGAVDQFSLTQLQTWVDLASGEFKRDDAPDLVHNLHLAFLQVAPIDYLHFNMQTFEAEYRQAVGSTAYEAYLVAIIRKPTDPPETPDERERLLRAEATYLVNETRRQQLLRLHSQSTRQSLLAAALHSWWRNIIPLLALLAVFFFCLASVNSARESANAASATSAPSPTPIGSPTPSASGSTAATASPTASPTPADPPQPQNWTNYIANQYLLSREANNPTRYTQLYKALIIVALLSLAGIAGATGGLMSVIQRVQASVPDSDPLTDLLALSQAETAVFFAPLTGLMFAFVLSLFFAGGVLSGSVFPKIETGSEWYFVLFNGSVLATWLLWAFLAGFCERLVPDALDTLAKRQSDNSSKGTPVGARSTPQDPGQPPAQSGATKPVLDTHPDPIPNDAPEMTIVGSNFDKDTTVSVDSQKMEIIEFQPTSLRVKLAEGVLKNKAQAKIIAHSPKAGDSNTLVVNVNEPGN
jgi:hypothetical protein